MRDSEQDGRYTPVREIEMVDAQTELYEVNTKVRIVFR